MQKLLVWQNNAITVNCSIETLNQALEDQQATIWLDIETEGNLIQYRDILVNTFQLSDLVIDSVEEEHERAKLVELTNGFYLIVHGLAFDSQSGEAVTPKLDIVFGHNFLVTIHREQVRGLSDVLTSASKDRSQENIMQRGVPRLLYAVLDTLVDSYFPVLDELDELVDDLEEITIRDTSNEVQARLFRTKRSVAQMRRVISPQVEVMNSLIMRTGSYIPKKSEPYFADIHDHLVRVFEVLDSYRDLLSGLLDVHLSTVSNRLNQIMKQLTIIATIFMPITFITGIFGQNFGHSPQVEHDPGYNFWMVLVFMALLTLGQLLYFRYRKWI